MPVTQIPVIDISSFQTGNSSVKRAVAEQVEQACQAIGFLVIAGHGVPQSTVTALYDAGKAFFDLPLEEKLRVRRPRNDQNRGYIPYGEETLARMHGGHTPPDFKEVFAIGPDKLPDEPYYTGPNAYPNFAPNLWPDRPVGLYPAMNSYFSAMEQLMRLIARIFAVALEQPEDYFEDKLDKHTSQLRLLHYPCPDQDLADNQLRCGVHSDLGMITILRNEAAPGGLQVRTPDGEWIDAPAIENTFVVNLGDLMMRWTNDRWLSTPHRVAVPPLSARLQSRRLSIGYFVGPNYDAIVECIDTCRKPSEAPRYEPVTVHDYRTHRFAAGAGIKPAA